MRSQSVTKRYAVGVRAIDRVDLAIASGEFMVPVEPSGCGKTTLLRMFAGSKTCWTGRSASGS
ncbi:MAG TPA: ATP-binding cassette domain-containing protein [Streptosporangiaceae bacterium]|nr:ATP-binding cassette domain-containing protein [Streptosporangiaceae bacterium]